MTGGLHPHDTTQVSDLGRETGPALPALTRRLIAEGVSDVVIDLSEVTHVDSSGLAAVLVCRHIARAAGADLSVCSPSRSVLRALSQCGLDGILTVCHWAAGDRAAWHT